MGEKRAGVILGQLNEEVESNILLMNSILKTTYVSSIPYQWQKTALHDADIDIVTEQSFCSLYMGQ